MSGQYAVIGSPGFNSNRGKVYIFYYNDSTNDIRTREPENEGSWIQTQIITQGGYVLAVDDYFLEALFLFIIIG